MKMRPKVHPAHLSCPLSNKSAKVIVSVNISTNGRTQLKKTNFIIGKILVPENIQNNLGEEV